ncbi:MAG: SUMF1/EgtB/PvdO family nonheme iron enzyme, partial [Planctomycetaceae bacterium]
FCSGTALAEHRAALVIGNSNYPNAPLASPPHDIRAVAAALRSRGFTVTQAENLKAAELKTAFATFARSVPTRGTALVYFSGYALPQREAADPAADNALLPIDGNPHHHGTVFGSDTSITRLMGILAKDSGSVRQILIVDACYPHPGWKADLPKGLVKTSKPAPESLVIFAAPMGDVIQPSATGLSTCATQFTSALAGPRPLNQILAELSPTSESTFADLTELERPASVTVTPPTELRAGASAGDEWVSDRGMVFCWCPPGNFTIGSPQNSPGHDPDEFQADVELPQGFWIGRYEFTRREMLTMRPGVYLSTGDHKLHPLNKLHGAKDVDNYLEELNKTAPPGWVYDVPTEAEWEYAARAGSSTDYFFGNDPSELARYGNFADRTLRESDSFGEDPKSHEAKRPGLVYFGDRQSGIFTYAHRTWTDGHATMALVGSYPPNPWGLHDVHGNIAEWTSTLYHPGRLIPDQPDPNVGPVAKGGSWLSTASYCRSAMRSWAVIPENGVGLRFVLRQKTTAAVAPVVPVWTSIVPTEFTSSAGATATISPDGSVLVSGPPVAGETYTLKVRIPAGIEPKAIRLEALSDPSLPKQGPGRGSEGHFLISELTLLFGAAGADAAEARHPLRLLDASASFEQHGTRILDAIDGHSDANTGWGNYGATGKDQTATFPFGLPSRNGSDSARWKYPRAADVAAVADSPLTVVIEHHNSATLGKFRLAVMHEAPASP